MAKVANQNPLLAETRCGSRLQQLQKTWDDVGENDDERDRMLLGIEKEDVYKRNVDQAAKSRAKLLKALADAQVELTSLLSALGDKTFAGIPDRDLGTIKKQLSSVVPTLEKLWKEKDERIKEFYKVQSQTQKIRGEITGTNGHLGDPSVDESDLSLKRLDDFQSQLQELQKEKSDRLQKVLEFCKYSPRSLCSPWNGFLQYCH